MKKFIEKLHFITHDINHLTHIEQAQMACEAGAKWIQYRCLSKNDDELLKDIHVIAEICDDWGATLIVTDHIHLNGKADIQGFHIENMSADFTDIRNLVGEDITLGGSSNTIENLLRIAQEGADYAGFGPFAETRTKPNSYPHIDLSQYHQAVMVLRDQGLDLPILAVGGVKLEDLDDLFGAGIFGIAVSSAINQAADMNEAYRSFYDKIM
ncbi:thiamine phosphate synthase [Pedobacter psychroterrae]|uniref:Thiamine phosphate synthase n=1 Tax=Pedobacter psychroterrae TaxID=2530453 RepID=A0A4R0NR24_9SPHI|nr:thiamine phosphate synthase [Pedobacter psychroterrae]TCD03276.1 thiamine phosphate synthase [Pedobacter psychroterrae]